jgi:hypothetical protein
MLLHAVFKFLALSEVANGQKLATAVDIKPFSGLFSSLSAKNLQATVQTPSICGVERADLHRSNAARCLWGM